MFILILYSFFRVFLYGFLRGLNVLLHSVCKCGGLPEHCYVVAKVFKWFKQVAKLVAIATCANATE